MSDALRDALARRLAHEPLHRRLAVLAVLARSGALAAASLDVRTAIMLAVDADAPGRWMSVELRLASPRSRREAWDRWQELCAAAPASDVADYRDLLDERYAR